MNLYIKRMVNMFSEFIFYCDVFCKFLLVVL